jgi:hypothetical protein
VAVCRAGGLGYPRYAIWTCASAHDLDIWKICLAICDLLDWYVQLNVVQLNVADVAWAAVMCGGLVGLCRVALRYAVHHMDELAFHTWSSADSAEKGSVGWRKVAW